MCSALRLIPRVAADRLLKVEPRDIRASLAYECGLAEPSGEIIVADQAWMGRPIDGQVGDIVCVPTGTNYDEASGKLDGDTITLTSPGISRVYNEELRWAAFLRVSRKDFAGLAEYRHLEETDDELTAEGTPPQSIGGTARYMIDTSLPTDAL